MISALPNPAKPSALPSTRSSVSSVQPTRPLTRPAWKKLLPREHGSWSLAFEPMALGLIAAFSPAGLFLSLAVVAAFLSRRPWQLSAELPEARTALAILGTIAAVSILAAIKIAGVEIALPLLAALPFGLVFAWYDSQHAARDAVPEIAGAAAFACVPAALALSAGLRADHAWLLTALMLARAVPTVCVVRSYLRARKNRDSLPARVFALTLSFVTASALFALVRSTALPAIAAVFAALLTLRALWLLGPFAPDFSAKRLGIAECIFGLVYVITLGLSLAR